MLSFNRKSQLFRNLDIFPASNNFPAECNPGGFHRLYIKRELLDFK